MPDNNGDSVFFVISFFIAQFVQYVNKLIKSNGVNVLYFQLMITFYSFPTK